MVVFPGAKINLGLNILKKLPNGFHDIETCMVAVTWSDVLELVPSQRDNTTLVQSGLTLDCEPADNLIMKAWRLLANDFDMAPVEMYLDKCVPSGAGLGGGSADATATLLALKRMYSLPINDACLERYAAQLGSDCPFFVYSKPMICKGTGIEMDAIEVPALQGKHILIVKPDFGISTAEAYRGCKPQMPHTRISDILRLPVEQWRNRLVNDFEKSLASGYPQIEAIKELMYESGAVYASLSGSGSAVYGIYYTPQEAKAAQMKLHAEYMSAVCQPVNPM